MTLAAIEQTQDYLRALPGDEVRQILWRFADRYDLQMLVQSVRAVARGPVARLVAAGLHPVAAGLHVTPSAGVILAQVQE